MTQHNHELGQLQARVDMILSGQMRLEDRLEAVRKEIVDRMDNHSRRLSSLEHWRSFLAGAMAVIGGIVTWIMGWSK